MSNNIMTMILTNLRSKTQHPHERVVEYSGKRVYVTIPV